MNENSFPALGISSFLVSRLEERGIAEPTEIQRRIIPTLLGATLLGATLLGATIPGTTPPGEGRKEKFIFRSATGTGKTFAYLLPILEKILSEKDENPAGPRCMICAPTHELCSQIKREADFLLAGTGLKTALLIGSAQIGRQIESLKKEKPVLAVGNPGRLLNLANLGKLKLRRLEFLILDEGDRLVSDELLEETRGLVYLAAEAAPPGLSFVSCSATFSRKSREILSALFERRGGNSGGAKNGDAESGGAAKTGAPTELIETDENILRDLVEHWAFFSEERQKLSALRSFAAASPLFKQKGKVKKGRALIFTARARQVGNIVSVLQRFKIDAGGLSGGMDKAARKKALEDFRSGKIRFLVTSDLAARGLDIPDIDCVIALDTGEEADSYVHRAGRTARAGKRGLMVTIGNESELRRLAALEKKLKLTVFPKELYGGKILAPETTDEP